MRDRARVRVPGRRGRAARRARRDRRRGHRAPARDGGPDRGRARCSSSGSTGVRTASARCCRSRRPSLPGEATRLDEFRGRLAARSPRAARRSPTTTRSSARRSTAGSCRCSQPSRTARSSCASRSARCSAAATGSGRRPRGWRCSSARTRRERGELFARLRGLTSGGHASQDGRRHDPPRALEVLMPGDRLGLIERLDDSLLGLKPRPRSYFGVAVDRKLGRGRSRHEVGTKRRVRRRLPSRRWTRRARSWPGSSGSRRSRRAARPPGCCSTRCAALLREAEAWVRAEPGGTDLAETALERCRDALRTAETGTEARAGLW